MKWTVEIGGIPTMTNLAGPWSLGALRPFHSFSALRCSHFGVSCEILGMYPVELPGKIGAWTGDNGQCEPRVLRVNAHLDGEPNGVSYGNIMWISPMGSGTWNHNFINYRLVCGSIPLQTMVNWDHDHWISQVGKAARNTTTQQPYLNIFLVFCQQCAGNPSANGNFFRFQSQKRSQSKNEDQEKNGPWLLSCYFDTDLPENKSVSKFG
jgi:hypothetical protein